MEECEEINYKKNIEKKKLENDNEKDTFINLCIELMDNSTIYDRRLYKEEFKKIYNNNKYTFSLNDNFLSNII